MELEPKPNTRSAAVTIILRFTRDGQVVDLDMLNGEHGLIQDSGLMTAGTRRCPVRLSFPPLSGLFHLSCLLSKLKSMIVFLLH